MKKHISCALIGLPNSGKSTLINKFIGQKISIVTPKIQTTRCVIKGILTKDDTQIIFFDSPGIFNAKIKRDREMVRSAISCISGADLILLVIDVTSPSMDKVFNHLNNLKHLEDKIIFVFNKSDISTGKSASHKKEIQDYFGKQACICEISARMGSGLSDLLKIIRSRAASPEWLYDAEEITDAPMRFLAAEVTREKLFIRLGQELPYNLTVENEHWSQNEDGSVTIHQLIKTIRKSHKNIIIGAKGSKIKEVGMMARRELTKIMQRKVHLFLFIKEVDERKFNYYKPDTE